MEAAYKTGNLDPSTCLGFATITEHVVIDVLGDSTKEKFGSSYDLISKSLGKVNVKFSCLRSDIRSRKYWYFSKNDTAKIPDNYVCLGFDAHQTEILKVWIIPGNSEVVTSKGIHISPNRQQRVKNYIVDPKAYDSVFQNMDIKNKPEFYNTTKPKVSESRYIYKQYDIEFEEDLKRTLNQPPATNQLMLRLIRCSAPLQKIVLYSIVQTARKNKLPFDYDLVSNHCMDLAEKYNYSYVTARKCRDSIGNWFTCGVIKAKYPKIKEINADLNDIEEAILQDSEFKMIREGEQL